MGDIEPTALFIEGSEELDGVEREEESIVLRSDEPEKLCDNPEEVMAGRSKGWSGGEGYEKQSLGVVAEEPSDPSLW